MGTDCRQEKERMLKYKTLAVAFSYPDEHFFKFFPQFLSERKNLLSEYDRLFRTQEIWLYGSEYICENEFQRVEHLSDINGFYRAFGLETNGDRPDSLANELEFMHYLIFKTVHALESRNNGFEEKAAVCLEAQKKFFETHLYTTAQKISSLVIMHTQNNFYYEIAKELIEFLESEVNFLRK
jgi:TorA maturation chaperone TorD